MRLSHTARRRGYLVDHGYAFLGFLLDRNAKMDTEAAENAPEMDFLH